MRISTDGSSMIFASVIPSLIGFLVYRRLASQLADGFSLFPRLNAAKILLLVNPSRAQALVSAVEAHRLDELPMQIRRIYRWSVR